MMTTEKPVADKVREIGSARSKLAKARETWPEDRFEWRVKKRLPGDVALGAALDSIATEEIDWDLIVWWNQDVARAAWRLDQNSTLDVIALLGPDLNVALVDSLTGRLPRSERRAVEHLELAVSHLLRSVEDMSSRPFRVYDPVTGIWRQEGEWINADGVGINVMSVVDRMIGAFEMAIHRGVDLMQQAVDRVAPPVGKLHTGATDQEKAEHAAAKQQREELLKRVTTAHRFAQSISEGRYKSIRSELRSRLAMKQTLWDTDTRWLVLRDGMVDVEDVYEHGRVDVVPFSPFAYSTMALDVAWSDSVRNAGPSMWQLGIEKVLPDVGVRTYLQKRFGTALLGRPDVADKSMVWQYGPGDTAKSTLQECIAGAKGVFAAYAIQSSSAVLTKKGQENGASDRFKAYARGKRFAIMSEIEEGELLDQETLKGLIGGDTVQGTAKYANAVTYYFTATLFMASNHAPRMPPGDPAAATRIHVVPFEHRLWIRTKNPQQWEAAKPEHRADPDWKARVLESPQERAAIFRWVLDGLVAFSRDGGLGDLPEAMVDKREEFMSDADPSATLVRSLLGEEPGWEAAALLKIYSDDEWDAAGFKDGDGIHKRRLEELIKHRARELDMGSLLGEVPKRLVLNARGTLSDRGGNWGRVAVIGTTRKDYGMKRIREVSL